MMNSLSFASNTIGDDYYGFVNMKFQIKTYNHHDGSEKIFRNSYVHVTPIWEDGDSDWNIDTYLKTDDSGYALLVLPGKYQGSGLDMKIVTRKSGMPRNLCSIMKVNGTDDTSLEVPQVSDDSVIDYELLFDGRECSSD